MKTVTLAAPVSRAPAVAVKLSQVLVSFNILTANGACVQRVVLSVEGQLSPASLAELEALGAAAAKSRVEAGEAAPPAPAPAPAPLPGKLPA